MMSKLFVSAMVVAFGGMQSEVAITEVSALKFFKTRTRMEVRKIEIPTLPVAKHKKWLNAHTMSSDDIGAEERIQRFFGAVASKTNGEDRKIIFVRHVESDWNVAERNMKRLNIFSKHANLRNTLVAKYEEKFGDLDSQKGNRLVDPVASKKGVQQALNNVGALKKVLNEITENGEKKVLAFSSPLKRCLETGALMTADEDIQGMIADLADTKKVHVAPFLTEDGHGPDLNQVDDVERVKEMVLEDVRAKANEQSGAIAEFLTKVDDSSAFEDSLSSSKDQIKHTTTHLNKVLDHLLTGKSLRKSNDTPLLIFGHSNWGREMMKMGKMKNVRKLDNAEVAVFDMTFTKEGDKWDFTIQNAQGYTNSHSKKCGAKKECLQCRDFTKAAESCSGSGAGPTLNTQITIA